MKKHVLSDFILNLLFPRRCPWCGAVLGFAPGCSCQKQVEALRLPGAPLNLDKEGQIHGNITAAYACFWYEEPISTAIRRVKFHDDVASIQALGTELATLCAASRVLENVDVLVPVPVSGKTLKKRGYNQCALLADTVCKQAGVHMIADVLCKPVDTKHQMDLTRDERMTNVKGAYAITPGKTVNGLRVLLLDDVITTGSTLDECAKTLLAAGARSCTAVCLACTSKNRER